jgi:ABC-type phosphate transport system substrate-binding protein
MKRALGFLAAVLLTSTLAAQEASYKVIVNASNSASSVKREAVAQLFLNRKATWSSGPSADPVDLSMTSPVREAFSREILGMPLPAVQQYWRRRLLEQKEFPPKVKSADAEIVAYVAKSVGGIGYVSAAMPLSPEVKVLKIPDPLH